MAKFVSSTQLYETVRQKSKETRDILWVCSSNLGLDAHEVFSQETIQHAPLDVKFIFTINDVSVKACEVNPYEVQFFMDHFKNSAIRSLDELHSNIYLFDNSALIASAGLTKNAFESNWEAGVLLEGLEIDPVKGFFCENLWEKAKPIKDVRKFKKMWNPEKWTIPIRITSKGRPQTKIENWKDDSVSTWYFSVLDSTTKKAVRKIQKEAHWAKQLELVSDIGPNAFRQLKLGDLTFIVDLTKKRTNNITVKLARIFDKSRVETDGGDLHFAYETKRAYSTERNRLCEMLEAAGIHAKNSEILLNQDQAKIITDLLSSSKAKKRRKARKR